MRRRDYLTSTAGLLGGLSGCVGAQVDAEPPTAPGTTGPAVSTTRQDGPPEICRESERDVGIIEIAKPTFGPDWDGIDVPARYGDLRDDDVVIGVERDGAARAYPLSILWHHEIVNDAFGGPILVSYCPLCRSGLVAERLVHGESTVFRVSGLLWRPDDVGQRQHRAFGADRVTGEAEVVNAGNLVMVDDATTSYWSQLLARAICGPRRGQDLALVPSTVARWGGWRAEHPGTDVLLPPAGPSPPDLA